MFIRCRQFSSAAAITLCPLTVRVLSFVPGPASVSIRSLHTTTGAVVRDVAANLCFTYDTSWVVQTCIQKGIPTNSQTKSHGKASLLCFHWGVTSMQENLKPVVPWNGGNTP